MPFTDKQIGALKPKVTRYERKEPGRTGLAIRVTPAGQKTWSFIYRFAGAQRRMQLGSYPAVGVAKAHVALADAKDKLRSGIDPGAIVAEERRAEREAETIEQLVDEYLERHARKTMAPATAAEDERALRRDVLPHWKHRKAKDITRRDAIRLLDEIEDRGAMVMRNRVAGMLSRLFQFGLDRGILEASPMVRLPRVEETTRARFLSIDEIRRYWHGLADADATPSVVAALRFLLLTGQRRGEVAGIVRGEIDDDAMLWQLPGSRTKNARDNLVPLPPLAMALVQEADQHRVRPFPARPNRRDATHTYDPAPSPWLFRSVRYDKPLEPAALTRALNRNRSRLGIGDATVHDLRRTFATWHGEIGTSAEVLSALLNHAPTSITGQVYNRATNLEPRRRAMEMWCDWLQRVIDGEAAAENVVRLSAARDVAP